MSDMKQLRKIALITWMGACSIASMNSCSGDEKASCSDREYLENTRDSLMRAYGAPKFVVPLGDSLESELTLLGRELEAPQFSKLEDGVQNAANEILDKYAMQIVGTLAEYGVNFAPKSVADAISRFKSDIDIASVGAKDGPDVITISSDYLLDFVKSGIGHFDNTRQDEIKQKVENIFNNMLLELQSSRHEIEKKFALYFPILDKSQIPEQWRKYVPSVGGTRMDDGLFIGGHDPRIVRSDFVIERCVSVYDSRLNIDFFGEKDATYKLVQVKPHQWQVVKTSANGKVSKTHVFRDNNEYLYDMVRAQDFDKPTRAQEDGYKSNFHFEAGANSGVHITVREYPYVKHGKSYDMPASERAQKQARYDKLLAIAMKKYRHDSLYMVADSIANRMLQERQNRR